MWYIPLAFKDARDLDLRNQVSWKRFFAISTRYSRLKLFQKFSILPLFEVIRLNGPPIICSLFSEMRSLVIGDVKLAFHYQNKMHSLIQLQKWEIIWKLVFFTTINQTNFPDLSWPWKLFSLPIPAIVTLS